MSDTLKSGGLEATPERAAEAAAALEGLRDPAERAATAIEDAFGRAGESMVRSLARAASDGEITLAELARAVLSVVNGAGSGGESGLSGAIAAAVSGAFSGSRADGGGVLGGGAYLVGERGPEVFRPHSAGTIEPAGGAGLTVNLRIDGGAQGLLRSETQIAQMLARAVALGTRRL